MKKSALAQVSSPKAPKRAPAQSSPIKRATGAGEVAFLILDSDFAKFIEKEAEVLKGEDPEAVHDMRVAARRIRSALHTFNAFLPAALLALEPEVQWIFKKLGAVRDLDIEQARLSKWCHSNSKYDGALIAGRIQNSDKQARKELEEAIKSDRYQALVAGLTAAIGKGPSSHNSLVSVPVLVAAPDLMEDTYKKALKSGEKLSPGSSDKAFHNLRKRAKEFRYTLEFFGDMYGKPAEQMIDHLKLVQNVLGARQDDIIAGDHLKKMLKADELTGPARAQAKKILCSYEEEARRYEHELGPFFQSTFGKPWKKLAKVAKKARAELWNR